MSKYYRGSLPDGEEERIETNTLKVLAYLQEEPRTNAWFAANGQLDYRRRCNSLRRDFGKHIKAKRIKGGRGLYEYRLLDGPEPEWDVVLKTTVPDGQFLIYSVVVNAATATEARNNAPRKYVINKILSVHRRGEPGAGITPSPPTPPKGGLQAENNMLRELVFKLYKRLKDAERKAGTRTNDQRGGQKAP